MLGRSNKLEKGRENCMPFILSLDEDAIYYYCSFELDVGNVIAKLRGTLARSKEVIESTDGHASCYIQDLQRNFKTYFLFLNIALCGHLQSDFALQVVSVTGIL